MTQKILTPTEAAALAANLSKLSVKEKLEALELIEKSQEHKARNHARTDMIEFAKYVYPGFKVGPHHRKLARIFTDVIEGRKKRVIINIAPRMGKSEFSSYLFPAFFLGNYPEKKIIMGTHTAGLSEDFGRRVRNLIDGEEYHELFPQTLVADDQKAAGKWSTSAGGQYYAAGVGGALAGRGADLFVIDDPHSEQDVKINSRLAFDTAWSWFQTGPLQRLMPGGAIILIMTRWSLLDLTGKLIDYQVKNPDTIPPQSYHYPTKFNNTFIVHSTDDPTANFNTNSEGCPSLLTKTQELALTHQTSAKKHPFGAPSNSDLATHMILFNQGTQPPMAFGKATLQNSIGNTNRSPFRFSRRKSRPTIAGSNTDMGGTSQTFRIPRKSLQRGRNNSSGLYNLTNGKGDADSLI